MNKLEQICTHLKNVPVTKIEICSRELTNNRISLEIYEIEK